MDNLNGFYSGLNGELIYIRWSQVYGYYMEQSHETSNESYVGEKIPTNYKFLAKRYDDKKVQDYAKTRPLIIAMNQEESA